MLAALSPPVFLVRERYEAIDTFYGADDHAATMATIAPVGAAIGNVHFSSEANATVATFASFDFDFSAVHKHRIMILELAACLKKGSDPFGKRVVFWRILIKR
jgi:hypothetical protein